MGLFLPAVLLALGSGCSGKSADPPADPGAANDEVTAVRGPSWLKHLGLQVSETHMGQMGGTNPLPYLGGTEPEIPEGSERGGQSEGGMGGDGLGGRGMGGGMMGGGMGGGGMDGGATGSDAAVGDVMRRFLSRFRSAGPDETSKILHEPFNLTGADLYRLNCQSCHGPDGQGAPPEINSLIGPIRATSPDEVLRQLEARGRTIPRAMAEKLAAQADSTLRLRLTNGGEKMPSFTHLRGDEVLALESYLRALAGAGTQEGAGRLVPQSAARVGEHLVKGTCHICHDAVGPGGGNMAMMQGIIPSLESMPRESSLGSVLHQVQYGSSGMMMMMGGQRMPAFPYITQEEAAAAYFYLRAYPPLP